MRHKRHKRLVVLIALLSAFCLRTTAQQAPEYDGLSFGETFHRVRCPNPRFLDQETGIMELELDNSGPLGKPSRQKARQKKYPVTGRVVIDFSKNTFTLFDIENQELKAFQISSPRTLTMFNDEKQETETFQISGHRKIREPWTFPGIIEIYKIAFNGITDSGNYDSREASMTQWQDGECYLSIRYPPSYESGHLHIRSITRKKAQ